MLRLTLLAAVAALLLPAASAAAQKKMTLSVDVTGIHQVDWEYVSEDHPKECAHWAKGQGQQTLGFSTPRPMRVSALVHTGKRPKGVPAVQLFPTGQGRWRSTVSRTGEIKPHVPGPSCQACGGELGACDGGAAPAPAPAAPSDCGRKTPRTPVASLAYLPKGSELPAHAADPEPLTSPVDLVQLGVGTSVGDLFKTCAPAAPAPYANQIEQPDPLPVNLTQRATRLAKLKVGGTLTLKGHTERGSYRALDEQTQLNCTMERPSFGYYECAITDATLEIRRLR